MKDIKEKVRDQSPKIRNPASRLPKELVRSAMLETKEKTSIMADKLGRETGEESPVEYAGNRIQRVEQRVGKESASAAYRGGKKLAVKTYEKLKEQKQKQREAATAPLDRETGMGGTSAQAGQTKAKKGRTEAMLWSSIFVTLMANKIGGLQFGIYRNCQISSRVFHTAVAALPLTKANRSDFE